MKEKINDFGVLGKWSKSTLIAQGKEYIFAPKRHNSSLVVPAIEEKYNEELRCLNNWISKAKESKVKKLTIGELLVKMNGAIGWEKRKEKLEANYLKYRKLISKKKK